MENKTVKPLIIIGIIILAGLIGFNIFRALKRTPFFGPIPSPVLKEPKKIGVLYFRQELEIVEGLKEGLKELGYEDVTYDETLLVAGPTMDADMERAVKGLVEERVDLIYATLEHQAKAAIDGTKEMSSNIPVVFVSSFHDPIEFGLAESYQSSGNNATGVAIDIVEVVQKQLEFLKELDPNIKKIGVFSDGFMVPEIGELFLAEFKAQAPRFGFDYVEYTTAAPPPEAEEAWYQVAKKIKPGDIDAVYHVAGHYFGPQEVAEAELVGRLGIPHVAPIEDLPTGGHFGYSGELKAAGKQSTRLIDKIFRGEKPSDIPIEFTKKNILVIYIARAKKAGIEFPDSILSIADKIVQE